MISQYAKVVFFLGCLLLSWPLVTLAESRHAGAWIYLLVVWGLIIGLLWGLFRRPDHN